jgi:MoaA/NifB/PqqE/SkfB family radical SAM enzyme
MTPVMTRGPSVIVFSNDMTCNLHCWSCRSKPIIEKRQDEIFRQTKNVLDTFHDSIKFISAIGSGDPLASPAWLKILQTFDIEKYDNLDIELFTNGLLIPKYWDSLSHLHDNITRIKMSVDAASKDIYEKTRLGGKFEDLNKAMKFISNLGKDFILNMVVESDNFTDIPLFIERALEHNSTRVNLTMLRDWPDIRGGTSTFKEKSLANVNHPKYGEFLKLLQNNEDLLSHPIVDASRIRPEGHAIL